MTSDEIIAVVDAIIKRHGRKPSVLAPACATVIGGILKTGVDPQLRSGAFASLVDLVWSTMTDEDAKPATVVTDETGGEFSPEQCSAVEDATFLLIDLYVGMLGDEPAVAMNAWVSAHLEVTRKFYGAAKAAEYMRCAADAMERDEPNRAAVETMDELATHGAGRA